MARSMVSSGTEASRAFWNIVRSVAFVSGSPPPSRAATSTWRMSLAKSLPRALSGRALLVLDRGPLGMTGHQATSSRNSWWSRRSPVSSGWNAATSTGPCRHEHRAAVDRGQHLDAVAGPLDDRRPDEHGVERPAVEARRRRGRPRTSRPGGRRRCGARRRRSAPKLRWSGRPSSTSAASRIIPAQVPKAGSPSPSRSASGSHRPDDVEQHRDGGRLAAREDERVDAGEVVGRADLDGVGAERQRAPRRAGRRPPAGRGPRPCRRPGGSSGRPRSPAPLGQLGLERADLEARHGRRRGPG